MRRQLPICCDLESLLGSFKYLAEEFMWLVFVRVRKVLNFLHRICDPPIAHSDLHIRNVVIGYPRPNDQGIPAIKVIDFSLSKSHPFVHPDVDSFKLDVRGLLRIMDCIVPDYAQWNRDSCDLYLRFILKMSSTRSSKLDLPELSQGDQ